MLTNLLENAVKYTASQTKLGIKATVEEDQIHVEVWDEGAGIPTEQLQLIFNKFSRAVKESAIPGLGWGLLFAVLLSTYMKVKFGLKIIKKVEPVFTLFYL